MSYEDYRRKLMKFDQPRNHTIKNSWGVYDAYRYYRKNRNKGWDYAVTYKEYSTIIRRVHMLMREAILNNHDINLPHRMGRLELRRKSAVVKFKDGKLLTNRPINWDETLRLWHSDEESRNKKIFVRQEVDQIYRIRLAKGSAMYVNKIYYKFDASTQFKKDLSKAIKKQEIDAFEIWQSKHKVLR